MYQYYLLDTFKGARLHPLSPSSQFDAFERIYANQLALDAAVIDLTLWVERRDSGDNGQNVRGSLQTIVDNAGCINQGLARLKRLDLG